MHTLTNENKKYVSICFTFLLLNEQQIWYIYDNIVKVMAPCLVTTTDPRHVRLTSAQWFSQSKWKVSYGSFLLEIHSTEPNALMMPEYPLHIYAAAPFLWYYAIMLPVALWSSCTNLNLCFQLDFWRESDNSKNQKHLSPGLLTLQCEGTQV